MLSTDRAGPSLWQLSKMNRCVFWMGGWDAGEGFHCALITEQFFLDVCLIACSVCLVRGVIQACVYVPGPCRLPGVPSLWGWGLKPPIQPSCHPLRWWASLMPAITPRRLWETRQRLLKWGALCRFGRRAERRMPLWQLEEPQKTVEMWVSGEHWTRASRGENGRRHRTVRTIAALKPIISQGQKSISGNSTTTPCYYMGSVHLCGRKESWLVVNIEERQTSEIKCVYVCVSASMHVSVCLRVY